MSPFEGFPPRMAFTSVPNVFFSRILPETDDMDELKATLHVMAAIYAAKGSPRYVTFSELAGNPAVAEGFTEGKDVEESLVAALQKAVDRGTLLRLVQEAEDRTENIYLLNDEAGRRIVEKVANGELLLGLRVKDMMPFPEGKPPDIFTAYEQNIGMLTPMIADELRDAEQQYPDGWIREAIHEAVVHNKRSMRYIMKILETWAVEGKSDGTYRRDTEKTDPDKYVKGKYGHMVRRR